MVEVFPGVPQDDEPDDDTPTTTRTDDGNALRLVAASVMRSGGSQT